MNAVANAQVWHRRLSYLHAQSLDILRKRDGTRITFEGPVSDCDVWTVQKAQQISHPQTANHKVSRPFQLCYGYMMGPFTPVAITGYKYVNNITDEYTKWTAFYLLTNKNQALTSLQLFVGSEVIPFVHRILGAATRVASTLGRRFGSIAWRPVLFRSTPPSTRRSNSVCPNAWGELCAPWFGACSQTAIFHRLCGGSCSWRRRTTRTGLRIKPSKWRSHSRCITASEPNSRPFASLEPETSCTSRTPESSTPQPGKGRCTTIARRENLTKSGTQRLTLSWRAGTSPSSRHRRTCFPLSFKDFSVARSGAAVVGYRRRHFGERLYFIRRLTAGCTGLHRCSGLRRQHSR